MRRLTQAEVEPPDTFARTDYSRRQAFNADGSRMLVVAGDGAWYLYDPRVPAYVQQLPGFSGAVEPQWHPDHPEIVSYLPNAGASLQVLDLDLGTGRITTAGDLTARLQSRWPTATTMNTGAQGSPSADGRFWAFQVSDDVRNALGMIVWDKQQDAVVSYKNIETLPDHISMSPGGGHVVVSWADRTVSFDQQLENPQTLLHGTEHSDLAIGVDGQDYYVAVDHGSQHGDLFMTNLSTGKRTSLLSTYIEGSSTSLHISGKAFDLPGWVVLSTFDMNQEDPQWLYQRIWLVQLQANPKMYPLGFHQSTMQPSAGADNYWAEPHATINKAGTQVVFNSNWNGKLTDIDVYAIDIPPIASQ